MDMFGPEARDLAIKQFCNEPGSEADLRGHWSVMRGDPHADRPQRRLEFDQHLPGCGVCQRFEVQDAIDALDALDALEEHAEQYVRDQQAAEDQRPERVWTAADADVEDPADGDG